MIAPCSELTSTTKAVLDLNGRQATIDLVQYLALVVDAWKFRKSTFVWMGLLAAVHVLNVACVLQVGAHALIMILMSI